MFLGTYSPRMDAKGRIILPAKFREELSAGLVLTRGQERCLYVFPAAEFERIHERMRTAPLPGRAARDFLRVFLSGASDELPDKQGRITIPPILRQYAGLTDNLVVIGSGTRAEIWDAAAWEEYLARTEAEFASNRHPADAMATAPAFLAPTPLFRKPSQPSRRTNSHRSTHERRPRPRNRYDRIRLCRQGHRRIH